MRVGGREVPLPQADRRVEPIKNMETSVDLRIAILLSAKEYLRFS
jgi:hypothetical protein